MAINRKYSLTKGIKKVIISMLLIGVPVLLDILPKEWLNITLGGALALGLNYLKVKYLI